jgi:hypothetical protein
MGNIGSHLDLTSGWHRHQATCPKQLGLPETTPDGQISRQLFFWLLLAAVRVNARTSGDFRDYAMPIPWISLPIAKPFRGPRG